MATIRELFKSQKKDLYGLSATILIESRGIINPPRIAALATSSPDAIADAIGNQIGGALGGNPNRPSDTIFPGRGVLDKPYTLTRPTTALLRYGIKGKKDYFVKAFPAPPSLIALLKQGSSSSPAALAASLAISAVNNYGGKGAVQNLINKLKKAKDEQNSYGAKFQKIALGNAYLDKNVKFSDNAPVYEKSGGDYTQTKIQPRVGTTKTFTEANTKIINILSKSDKVSDSDITKFKTENTLKIPYVLIQKFEAKSTDDNILLPGTINGYSESFSPEWNSFKYLGSPFNIYKYGGVERTLSFGLKLYYLDNDSKITMQKNLNKLRKLVYPDDEISAISYKDVAYSPLVHSGTFIKLTIPGLLQERLGFITSFEISVDDEIPWGMTDTNMGTESMKTDPYPSNMNLTFGVTLIENHKVEKVGDKFNYKYNFTEPTFVKEETKSS